ncbi:MAG TPA: hypothetical protein PK649_01465 [Vicingus sp.]|nr:hypothetical protein [Vicingus sp.]HRP60984.1 hypothetical protein [Vicingus sp.]
MRHRLIKDVSTIIYKGRQRVRFEVEGLERCIYLSSGNVKQSTGVKIDEVEILIGSKLRPKFYQVGEEMYNGKICENESIIIKNFWIECSDSIEEMKIKNSDKLKQFHEINKVFQFYKNEKYVVGFKTIDEKTTFINSDRLHKLTLLDPSEYHILEGSYINPEYYQDGEIMHGGTKCYKSGIILKALNLRFYGKTEEMHERFEKSEPLYISRHYDNYDDGYDSSNWLSDAAGSDDPEIMSLAYWNMD